jgi:AAA domain
MTEISDLMREARENPAKPVIQGLLHEEEVAGLHGPPEVFKTMFTLQLAESLASGSPFLGEWRIPRKRTVYFFETEMSVTALGSRLAKMFKDRIPPSGVHFANETHLRRFRRAPNLSEKFKLLNEWVAETKADVVILDTCNPFFRGKESPNDETVAGAFFDNLAAVPASNKLFVRHNHKARMEDDLDSASKIRGSGQFADVPDLLLEITRMDKRTSEARLGVSKFRHGSKPDDMPIWFDSENFRLIAVPPVIHLLTAGPLPRLELLKSLQNCFGIGQRKADQMIAELRECLVEKMEGHRKVFGIDWNAAGQAALPWVRRICPMRETEEYKQGCINPSLSLDQDTATHQPRE